MAKEFVLNQELKLAIEETEGNKGTIIAVHGLTGNHKTFYHYKNSLGNDYHFISLDLRGRGNSSLASEDTSIFKHAEDLKAFIEMRNIKKPILIGYSMGAYVCALIASEIEVSALILLDGAGTSEEKQRELIIPSLSRLQKTYSSEEDYITQTRQVYDSLHVKWDKSVEEVTRYEVKETPDGWKHKSDASVMEKDFNSFYEFKPGAVFENITCPILLVIAHGSLGQKDPLFTIETYTETIATAKQLTTIEVPANHYTLMFEQQPKVEESILALLKKIKKVTV